MVSNPIYFQRTLAAPLHRPIRPRPFRFHGDFVACRKGQGLDRVGDHVTREWAFLPAFGGPAAAASSPLPPRSSRAGDETGAVTFTAAAVASPARVSVQLRYGGGERGRTRCTGRNTPRHGVPIGAMRPADRQIGRQPAATTAVSLLFVVDLTNALPGSANTIRISRVGFAPAP